MDFGQISGRNRLLRGRCKKNIDLEFMSKTKTVISPSPLKTMRLTIDFTGRKKQKLQRLIDRGIFTFYTEEVLFFGFENCFLLKFAVFREF
jgi:hypothetical protein